jgi:hypothetical protein
MPVFIRMDDCAWGRSGYYLQRLLTDHTDFLSATSIIIIELLCVHCGSSCSL